MFTINSSLFDSIGLFIRSIYTTHIKRYFLKMLRCELEKRQCFFFHNRNSSCDNNEILAVINMQCYCVKKAD